MEGLSQKIRTENMIFHVAIGIATLLLSVLGFIVAHEYKTLPALARETLSVTTTVDNIRYFDERLTMSATAAVYSGDQRGIWRARYLESADQLDVFLQQATEAERRVSGNTTISDAISTSNIALIKREEQAFAFLEQGRRSDAISSLEDAYYIQWKQRYSFNLTQLYNTLQNKIADNVRSVEDAATLKLSIFVVCFCLLLFTWLTAIFLLNRSRKALSSQYALLETIVEHMPLAMYGKDLSQNTSPYIRFNQAAEDFFGISRQDVLAHTDKDLFPEQEQPMPRSCADNDIATSDTPMIRKEEYIYTQHGTRTAHTVRVPVRYQGESKAVLVFIRDITQEIQSEQQLKSYANDLEKRTTSLIAATATAEEALRIKSLFLANMSHELRTPMHAIRSYAEMGTRRVNQADQPKIAKYLCNITTGAERLSRLLDDLLDLSKMEAGKMDFHIQPTSIHETIDCVYEEVLPLLEQKNIQLRISHDDSVVEALMDKTRIMQALINLLSNAIKFSPEGGIITLETGISHNRQYTYFRLTDEGHGIPEGEEDSIFHSFVQSSATSDGSGGTGLGLSICHKIVSAHEGYITAYNRKDAVSGAVFDMHIPINTNDHHMDIHYAII